MTRRDGIAISRMLARALVICAWLGAANGQATTLNATITAINALDAERQGGNGASPPLATPAETIPPMSDSEAQGYGCLVSGAIATGMTALAGTDELIKIVAGGTIGPATPAAAVVAFTGTVFASICAVGALATPALLRLYDIYYAAPARAAAP